MDVEFTTAIDFGTALYAHRAAQMGFRLGNADGFDQLRGDNAGYGYTLVSPLADSCLLAQGLALGLLWQFG